MIQLCLTADDPLVLMKKVIEKETGVIPASFPRCHVIYVRLDMTWLKSCDLVAYHVLRDRDDMSHPGWFWHTCEDYLPYLSRLFSCTQSLIFGIIA